MSFTPNFSAAYSLTNPSVLTLTDTSTNIPGGLTARIVYFQIFNGSYLTANGVSSTIIALSWPIGSTSYPFAVISKDYSIICTVKWLTGSTITDSKVIPLEINPYARIYRYKLVKALASNPRQWSNSNFLTVISYLNVYIMGGVDAIEVGNDVTLAQLCNNNAKELIDSPSLTY